jgi:hypothetical protein
MSIDFYPLSVLLEKAIVLGVEPDLVQRRDVNFSFFRFSIRVSHTAYYPVAHLLKPVPRHIFSFPRFSGTTSSPASL